MDYTVYFADKAVVFTAKTPGEDWYAVTPAPDGGISRAKVTKILESYNKAAVVTPDPGAAFGAFAAEFALIEAAGGGVGDGGSVVLRDRTHLAEDGMIVVCVNLSSEDGSIITGPDIITRGFIYVKESDELMEELRQVAIEAIERCQRKRVRDWSAIKSAIKNDLSGYLYKTTKRNPMILPVIMEI